MSKNQGKKPPPGVDIAIPCYQYGHFLRECVSSVLSQGMQEIRVLIIDNASTDNSVEVAQQLAAEDRRVEVVARRRNLGPHASFNEGIDWASSTYFMVLCADDLLAPGGLARAVSIMEWHPGVAIAYGRALWLRPQDPMPDLSPSAGDWPWRIVGGGALLERFCRTAYNHVIGPVVVRTVAQKLAGYYRPELPHTDDFEMWMRLACYGTAAETRAYQGFLRIHDSNRSAFARQSNAADVPQHERHQNLYHWYDEAAFESFFSHEGELLPEAARLHRLARRSLAERAYWAAIARLCRGQTGISRDLWKFAIKRRPSILPPISYLFRRDDLAEAIAREL
jgi:glycosyltransferase involved in cell wall biosynthesis